MPDNEETRGPGPGGPLAYAVHARQAPAGTGGPRGEAPPWERAADVVQAALRLGKRDKF